MGVLVPLAHGKSFHLIASLRVSQSGTAGESQALMLGQGWSSIPVLQLSGQVNLGEIVNDIQCSNEQCEAVIGITDLCR